MRAPPLQPPLVWQVCLLLYCAGILAALWPQEGLCAAALLLLADRRFRTPARVLLAFGLCAAGLGVGTWQLSPLRTPVPEPAWLGAGKKGAAQPVRICGDAVRVQGLPDGRTRVILENVRPEAGGEALAGFCAWTWDEPAFWPLAGQRLCVSRRPAPMRGFANAPEPAQEARWAAQGVYWRLWSRSWSGEPAFTGKGSAAARLREDLRRDLVRALRPPDAEPMPQAKAILPALLFGDRSFLSHATLAAFAATGLAHSLALSGQHLALAGLIGLFSVLALARLRPGIYLIRARAVWAALASLPPALAYLWLGNAPASLLRAACMLGFMTLWLLRERTATALDALLAALGCIVLADPLSLFDLSLQLSVMCVAVICLWVPALRRVWFDPARRGPEPGAPLGQRLRWRGRALARGLASIFCVSFCIQVSLLPFMLARFGSVGLWFPLNVLWLPAVDLVALPGAALGLACSALGLEACARVLLDVAALPCQALLACLDFLEAHGLLGGPELLRPHWTALLAFASLGTGLAIMAGNATPGTRAKARGFLVTGLILLSVGPCLRLVARLDGTPRLEIPDVGQGLAASLSLPGHLRLLIDGGGLASPRFDPGQALLAPLLADNETPRLDAVLNSHPDLDHAGGLDYLLRAFRVDRLFHNGRDAVGERRSAWRKSRELAPAAALAAGDAVLLGDSWRLEVLHPPRGGGESGNDDGAAKAWTGNNASLVLRLTRDGQGVALFTGDAGPAALRHLLATGADLSARILVAPHHGSDRSFMPELYAAVRPELVLAGCGFRNRWGYPGKRLAAWLSAAGIPLLDTGTRGRISVDMPREGPLRVMTARKAGPGEALPD